MSASAAALLRFTGRTGMADAAALSALVRESLATDTPRQVLLVRLGPLARTLRGEHHERLVRESLEPLLRPSRARLYALPNGDLAATGPEHGRHMDAVAKELATLLGPDVARPSCVLLRLPGHAAQVLAAVEEAVAAQDPSPVSAAPPSPRRVVTRTGPPPAPTPLRLAQAVVSANIAAFLRCRPVLRLLPEAPEAAVAHWTEWRVAVPELCAALLGDPGAAALSAGSPHLRGVLDQRLLSELARPEEATRRGPVGLSLGLAAVDSAAFRSLEGLVAPGMRAASVIGLPAEAVLADPLGFRAARQVLAARGWRLALDVPHPSTLALLPPGRTGIPLARLRFDPALLDSRLPPGIDPESLILTGVDRTAALGWGMEAGIRLFEGRLLAR